MMRAVFLAAAIGLIALPAAAQVRAPEGMGAFSQYYPGPSEGRFNSPGGESMYSAPHQSEVGDRLAREMRERIATGMVRKGRCDDALKLAKRQGDEMLAERVTATCTALRSGKWPT